MTYAKEQMQRIKLQLQKCRNAKKVYNAISQTYPNTNTKHTAINNILIHVHRKKQNIIERNRNKFH